MPENRFFLPNPFEKNKTLSIEGDELKHLRVMRRDPGDLIELVNGQNQLAKCQIIDLSKSVATLTPLEVTERPPPKALILAQALLRPKNLDLVIEKGTELGATAFWLFPSQNSEKTTLSENQLHRLQHLAISALKQCGRLDLPEILEMPSLFQWEDFPSDSVFGDLEAKAPLTSSPSMIFIGPEKGFSSKETEILHQKSKGIRLHTNILRAETAALCALSQASKLKNTSFL